jgi:FHS family glucose/mannose:H+ symporter-like MFS transporter
MQVLSPETLPAPPEHPVEQGSLDSRGSRAALGGFFISGLMLSFLGAILPSWQSQQVYEFSTVALYFIGLIAGIIGSVWAAPPMLARKGIGWTLAAACLGASVAFLYLAFVSPPMSEWYRVGGLALIGFSAGLLHTGIFQAISPMYRHNPAATVNLAGILFGLGCLTVALLVAGIYFVYTAETILAWIAVIPALAGWAYIRTRFAPQPVPHHPSPRAILAELRSPGAVLFSLLLFFQFGNEWAIAGWLPLFLTHRLGISPVTAIEMLALYWFALTIGRIAAQAILPRVRHARLLLISVLGSMFGCLVLIATDNYFGAITGILLLGGSFAPIYPLVVEKIGDRFPYYHPGFYNGIFSFAIAGGLLAPCSLGYFAGFWGVRAVMGLPLAGSIVVFILLLAIWLEARLSAAAKPSANLV